MTAQEKKWDHLLQIGFADGVRDKPTDWLFGHLPALEAIGLNLRRTTRNRSLRILDLGCGKGAVTRAMKRDLAVGWVCGVDTSPWAIREAAAHADGVCFQRTWSERPLPFPGDSFDGCLCAFVLCTMSNPVIQVRTLRKVRRVLVPGSRIAVVANNPAAVNVKFSSVETIVPEDRIRPGRKVRVKLFRLGARTPFLVFQDYWWPDEHYRKILSQAGFRDVEVVRPKWDDSMCRRFLGHHRISVRHFTAERTTPPTAIYVGRKP